MFAKKALGASPGRPGRQVDPSNKSKMRADAPSWALVNFLSWQVVDLSGNPKCPLPKQPLEKVSERPGKVGREFRQQTGVSTVETNVFAVW